MVSIKDSNVLYNAITKTVKHEAKNKKGGFIPTLFPFGKYWSPGRP